MTEPQVPRMPDLMTPAIDALVSELTDDRARIARAHFANHGRYGDILRGWRGQGEVVRARFAKEIIAGRLIATNGGQPLSDLAASEFFCSLAQEPQYAIGELYLTRQKVTTSSSTTGNFLAGVIPAGTKFFRPRTDGYITLSDAEFNNTDDVVCSADDTQAPEDIGGGSWRHRQSIVLRIRAANPGPDANTPRDIALASPPQRLFDSGQPAEERFTSQTIYSAGGLVSVPDAQLLDLCRAMGPGRNGANNAAALAGARTDPRVRRVAAQLDYSTAILWLYVADQSWATSRLYRDTIRQSLFDGKWIGFGSRVNVGEVLNIAITVSATVYLRSKDHEAEKSAITAAIQAKLGGYFDDRPDFYSWRTDAIGGVIATADPRVLTSGTPVVLTAGEALAEPAGTIAEGATTIPHYNLRGVSLTFASPGS